MDYRPHVHYIIDNLQGFSVKFSVWLDQNTVWDAKDESAGFNVPSPNWPVNHIALPRLFHHRNYRHHAI
ncbi:hypothetical protein DERF_004724 [Dermatophagoides farinae]|uniref:Uncharacterized protein n=1 Tax=Dermatophagoides farinae TaxID=6954 RepID=A0A922I4B3_DERFA|nr:hypothetical protein DERF_004724 [Dermatophagoides farinae]